jgi:hypothetical protein
MPGLASQAANPSYDTGHLPELVTTAITLYGVHPMAGHPVTEETALLTVNRGARCSLGVGC